MIYYINIYLTNQSRPSRLLAIGHTEDVTVKEIRVAIGGRGELRLLAGAGGGVLPRRTHRPDDPRADAPLPGRIPRGRHPVRGRFRRGRRQGGTGPVQGDLGRAEQHGGVLRRLPPGRDGGAGADPGRDRLVPGRPGGGVGGPRGRRRRGVAPGTGGRGGLLPAGGFPEGHRVLRAPGPRGGVRLRQLHPGVHRPHPRVGRPLPGGGSPDRGGRHQVTGGRHHPPPDPGEPSSRTGE